jgi:hypothetical protein
MSKTSAARVTEPDPVDVFADPAPAPVLMEVTAAATAVEPTVPEGWAYVDFLGCFLSKNPADKALRFETIEEVYAHLNKSSVDAYVDQFMAYVDAHPAQFFLIDAKPERTAKKDHVNEEGVVTLAKGTKLPAEPARLMEGVALDSAKTRLRSAATKVMAWQYGQQAAG